MAVSNLLKLVCIACVQSVSLVGYATEIDPDELAFRWSADVLNSDFRSDTLDLSGNVRVSQGPMSIEAHAATARDVRSERSRWTFTESVHIRTDQADLQSNTASALVVNGQIADARIEGSPAQFAQRGGDEDGQVQGRAGVIEYDFQAGVVRLHDNVWFSNGADEFRGDLVIYNVRDERVQINPDGQPGRVRGIIRPRDRGSDSTGANAVDLDTGPVDAPNGNGA